MPSGSLAAFLEPYSGLLRRSESRDALHAYVAGLQLPSASKTASEIARLVPGTSSQRLQEFLTSTSWNERAMDAIRVKQLLASTTAPDSVLALMQVVIPKAGVRSVGTARQCRGPRGGLMNCQRLIVAHHVDAREDWPVFARLYLPPAWLEDAERRRAAHIPRGLEEQSPGEIALDLLNDAKAAGVGCEHVVIDQALLEPALLRTLHERQCGVVVELSSVEGLRFSGPDQALLASAAALDELARRVPRDHWSASPAGGADAGGAVEIAALPAHLDNGDESLEGTLVLQRRTPGGRRATRAFFAVGERADVTPVRGRQLDRARTFYERTATSLGLRDYEGRLWHGLHRHLALVMLAAAYQRR